MEQRRSKERLWLALGVVIAAMAIAQSLGLVHVVADTLRTVFWAEGWYGDRRRLQRALIWASVIGVIVAGAIAPRLWPREMGLALPASVATAALVWFEFVRGISLHSVDRILSEEAFAGLALKHGVELLCLTAIVTFATLEVTRRGLSLVIHRRVTPP